jgi:hypothetical protein
MIHASDWIIFLENGISIEELPLSERHRNYCLDWLRQHGKIETVKKEYHSFNAEDYLDMLHQAVNEVKCGYNVYVCRVDSGVVELSLSGSPARLRS